LLSININFQFIISLTAYAHYLCLFHINLHTELSSDLIQVILFGTYKTSKTEPLDILQQDFYRPDALSVTQPTVSNH